MSENTGFRGVRAEPQAAIAEQTVLAEFGLQDEVEGIGTGQQGGAPVG